MGNEALEEISCPNCGLTYEEFRKTSNLGCSHCYRAFRRNLNFVIKNVQGSTAHKGKYPKINGKLLFSKKKILELKKLLAKSVEEEEYEQAARLRDEIRGLEALNND
jgi:protein arginine kinase activator